MITRFAFSLQFRPMGNARQTVKGINSSILSGCLNRLVVDGLVPSKNNFYIRMIKNIAVIGYRNGRIHGYRNHSNLLQSQINEVPFGTIL